MANLQASMAGAIAIVVGAFNPYRRPVLALSMPGPAPLVAFAGGQPSRPSTKSKRLVRAAVPAAGGMGIVDAVIGEARLHAEIEAAISGPLALSVIHISTTLATTLTGRDRLRAARAVGRAIDSTIGEDDVVYANGPLDFVAILPGSSAEKAASVLEEIKSAAYRGTILIGPDRRRQSFGDVGQVRLTPFTMPARPAV